MRFASVTTVITTRVPIVIHRSRAFGHAGPGRAWMNPRTYGTASRNGSDAHGQVQVLT